MTYFQYLEHLLHEKKVVGQNFFYLYRLQSIDGKATESRYMLRYVALTEECEKLVKAFESGLINPDEEMPEESK